MINKIIATREYREQLLSDPYRPSYHFAIPDDFGWPGDCNGAFFADGVYHIMYLYKNSKTNGYHWGHISSLDLLHWRHHKDALVVGDFDKGCYSGGAFVDDDKTAYLTFWKVRGENSKPDNNGIVVAYAKPPYTDWQRIESVAVNETEWGIKDIEVDGQIIHLACADPSNIWKSNGYYYMQLGNLLILDKYGRSEDSQDEYKGGWTELFRSKDLKNWEYVKRFYEISHDGKNDWPDSTEDCMCPSFLPLYDSETNGEKTNKYLQLFISHNKGCQYFVGELNGETFMPQHHGRMTWNDITYFAPEALVDDKNRQIMWVWMHGNLKNDFENYGWSGVFSFPRVLWWKNDTLHIAPAKELERIQYNHQHFDNPDKILPVKNGESFRLKAVWNENTCGKFGFKLRVDEAEGEATEIYIDKNEKKLVFDARNSGIGEWKIKEEAPFELMDNEKTYIDIFVDKSVVEVYVNNRQAICRRIYPSNPQNAMGVHVIGDSSKIENLDCWEMFPTNMY